ncbi:MAG: hypothetical protein IPI77_18195 [Saprospiraceae bacterium]|nr:hypothetical protein [Saprospiraceae bacterium]
MTWNNIKYVLDENKMLQGKLIGSFTQFRSKPPGLSRYIKVRDLPLSVPSSMLNHLLHGQVYVALSRCKSFEASCLGYSYWGEEAKSDGLITTFNDQTSLQDLSEKSPKQAKNNHKQSGSKELS